MLSGGFLRGVVNNKVNLYQHSAVFDAAKALSAAFSVVVPIGRYFLGLTSNMQSTVTRHCPEVSLAVVSSIMRK